MNKRTLVIAVSAVLTVVALAGTAYVSLAYAIYAYQPDTPVIRTMADLLQIPAAKVGKEYVPYTAYLKHLDALRVFLAGPYAASSGFSGTLTADLKKQTLDQAIRISMVKQMAAERHFVVTNSDVDQAYDELIARNTSTTPGDFHTYLHDSFNWTEQDFKDNVVRPAITEDGLRSQAAKTNDNDPTVFDKDLQDRLDKDVRLRIKIQ